MLAMASSGGSIEATDVDGARSKINGDDLYVTDDGTMNVDDMDDDLIVVDVGETSHDDATMTAAAAVAEAAAVAGAPERLSRPHQDMGLVSDPSAPSAAKAQQRVGEKDWEYNAKALGVALSSIPTADETVEAVEKAVKEACAEHGTRLARFTSKRGQRGRLSMVGLRCVHGMRNRQAERRISYNSVGNRKYSSQRSGCDFRVTIRWELGSPELERPELTAMHLDHMHPVDKAATEVRRQLQAPLSLPMEAEVAKLTDAGVAPAVQVMVLETLYNRRVNPRAVQKASSRCNGAKRPYDAQDLPITEKGPTVQERRLLYLDMLKEVTAIVIAAVETLPPDAIRMLVAQFGENVRTAARIRSGAGIAMGNSNTVRVPADAGGGERSRSADETRPT